MIEPQSISVKIAMAQIFAIDGDRSGNLARIEHAIIEAKQAQVDIVVFPETCILGWVNPDAHQMAFPIPGADSKRLGELAKKHGIYLCIGLAEKEDDQLFDSVILLDDRGKVLLKHRKINVLTELMTPSYSIGETVEVVNTPFGTVGLLICADTFQEDLLENMKQKKPDLLLVPYGWAAKKEAWPTHGQELIKVVKNASKVVGCPVVGTNLIGQISQGPWKGLTYGGGSVAYDHSSEQLIVGKDRDRDINIFTFTLPPK